MSQILLQGTYMGNEEIIFSFNFFMFQGDSGGPLQIKDNNPDRCIYYIVGITSFGKTVCGAKDSPAIYTRVSHYLSWIEATVWP